MEQNNIYLFLTKILPVSSFDYICFTSRLFLSWTIWKENIDSLTLDISAYLSKEIIKISLFYIRI